MDLSSFNLVCQLVLYSDKKVMQRTGTLTLSLTLLTLFSGPQILGMAFYLEVFETDLETATVGLGNLPPESAQVMGTWGLFRRA